MTRTLSTQAQAAAAIRKELKAAFPNTKFSVTSESFSMGDAVRIDWTDGPTSAQVDAIVRKYQYGHFDGMIDMYEYSNRRDDIPQTKFVSTQRRFSDDAYRWAIAEVQNHYRCTIALDARRGLINTTTGERIDYTASRNLYGLLQDRAF